MNEHHQYSFGPFLLNPAAHKLLRDGQPIPLTPKAFNMLVVLVENHGRLLGKEELIRTVWPDTFVEEGNLCVTVSLLRRVFGKEYPYIETVPKHGYRFEADISELPVETWTERHEDTVEVHPLQEMAQESDDAGETAVLPAPPVDRFQFSRLAVSLVVALVVGILFSFGVWQKVGAHRRPTLEIRSLAVLPFEILDAKPGDQYLGLGMADALITKLGNTGRIVTRPTRAIQKYQNTSQEPRAVGYEQGVDAVLDGRIQRAGDRVRVTAQLVRVVDGVQLWSDTFDEDFTDVFAVEDCVSTHVAASIQLELGGENKEHLAQRPKRGAEAYESYLRGRFFWNERTGEGLKKGLEYFQHAIELDPTYAEAYAGIADSYAMLGLYTVLPPDEAFPKAKTAAIKALKWDNTLAEAHSTLGFVHFYYDWDGPAAEKEFVTALQENPNYAMAHSWRGFNLAAMGRSSEALTEAKMAQEDDPLSAIIGTNAGWVYHLVGQDDEAVKILQKVIEIEPNFPRAHFRLGNIYEHTTQYQRAITEYEKAVLLSGGDTYYQASLGHAYAMVGMIDEARKNLHKLQELSHTRYVSPYGIALIYFGIGDDDRGFRHLQGAIADHSTSIAYLNVDPSLNGLRSDPRFADVLRQTNFRTPLAEDSRSRN